MNDTPQQGPLASGQRPLTANYFSTRQLEPVPVDDEADAVDFWKKLEQNRMRPPFFNVHETQRSDVIAMYVFFGGMRKAHFEAPRDAGEILLRRLFERITKGKAIAPSDAEHQVLSSLSTVQLAAFEKLLEGRWRMAFDCFASGSLAPHAMPPIVLEFLKFREPDGALFFAWAEYAILASQHGYEGVSRWRQILPVLLRAEHIYAAAYGQSIELNKRYFMAYRRETWSLVRPEQFAAIPVSPQSDELNEQEHHYVVTDACPAGFKEPLKRK